MKAINLLFVLLAINYAVIQEKLPMSKKLAFNQEESFLEQHIPNAPHHDRPNPPLQVGPEHEPHEKEESFLQTQRPPPRRGQQPPPRRQPPPPPRRQPPPSPRRQPPLPRRQPPLPPPKRQPPSPRKQPPPPRDQPQEQPIEKQQPPPRDQPQEQPIEKQSPPPPNQPQEQPLEKQSSPPRDQPQEQPLEILGATYGNKDVTSKIQEWLSDGYTSGKASNNYFGDPLPGIVKTCTVVYKKDGKILTKVVKEDEELDLEDDLNTDEQDKKDKILGATYGNEVVTDKVEELYNSGTKTIGATNENFGDPMLGIVKTLTIVYQGDDHSPVTKVVKENESIDLP